MTRAQRIPPRNPYNRKRLSKEERAAAEELVDYTGEERPRYRAECQGGLRPCPFVSCKYNLYISVKKTSIRINFPHLEAHEMDPNGSCALDVADANPDGLTLEAIGELLNITRERVRQIEDRAMRRLRWSAYAHRNTALHALLDVWEVVSGREIPGDEWLFMG